MRASILERARTRVEEHLEHGLGQDRVPCRNRYYRRQRPAGTVASHRNAFRIDAQGGSVGKQPLVCVL